MFTDDERRVFKFWHPVKRQPVCADPLAVYRKLVLAFEGDLNPVLDDWYAASAPRDASPEQQEAARTAAKDPAIILRMTLAEEKLVSATREAFNLSPLNEDTGEGATDAEVRDILTKYLDFFSAFGTPLANSPTAPPADSSASPSPGSTTPPSADSG